MGLAVKRFEARRLREESVRRWVALSQSTEAVDKIRSFFRSGERVVGPHEQKTLALLASIWKVDLDTKGALVGTKEFAISSEVGPKGLAEWVSSQLGLTARKDAPNVHLKVQISADLKHQKPIIQRMRRCKRPEQVNVGGAQRYANPVST